MALTKEQEISMFGETIEQMRGAVLFTKLDDPADLMMYSMSILSDTQEMLKRDPEVARQWINKAKYFMSEANRILRERER